MRYVGNHAVKIFRAVDFNEVNIFENGFLKEFLNAQKNLAAQRWDKLWNRSAGTVPLPILARYSQDLPQLPATASAVLLSSLN